MGLNPVTIGVDTRQPMGPLDPIWRSIGYDEINWTYTPTGLDILHKIRGLDGGPFHIRNHNAFTSGDRQSRPFWGSTNCYTEDESGNPCYDFSENDRIYDIFLENNCRPMIELGFMPHDLSSQKQLGPKESWRYPPRDYSRWRELNQRFAAHLIQRYGRDEVRTWFFGVWNEPDLDDFYFRREPGKDLANDKAARRARNEEYCKLYDYAADGILSIDRQLRVGGPETADLEDDFVDVFFAHCRNGRNHATGATGSRLDFISFHCKATGMKDGRVPHPDFDLIVRRHLERFNEILGRYPELRHLPVLGNEWDIDWGTAYGIHDSPDWNFRNTSYYPVFVIRSIKELLASRRRLNINLHLVTQWAFYMRGKHCFEGARALFDPMGIRMPVFNAFEMLAKMGATRIEASTDDDQTDVAAGRADAQVRPYPQVDALATCDGEDIQALVWCQQADPNATGIREVNVTIEGLADDSSFLLRHYRIDENHSNAYTAWKKLGSPEWPGEEQIAAMKKQEHLERLTPDTLQRATNGRLCLSFELPVHGVSLLVLTAQQ
jgi:xylan 1,4-beta-xylosidase